MSRADSNPWLVKMVFYILPKNHFYFFFHEK